VEAGSSAKAFRSDQCELSRSTRAPPSSGKTNEARRVLKCSSATTVGDACYHLSEQNAVDDVDNTIRDINVRLPRPCYH
jgi:hypothetical protein